MNKTHVRAGRLAGLHRQTLRARGAALAIEALNGALEASVGSPGPYSPLLSREFSPVATAAYFVTRQQGIRRIRFAQRRNAFYDAFEARLRDADIIFSKTRLARANGWGSAGQCPATHSAKTPAACTRANHVVGTGRKAPKGARRVARGCRRASVRDASTCASAQQPRGAIA